ncbi:MAG: RNA 2',3'-cyclic phosphodiesterase [Ruminiclostridium sp.]|nr:RNA 2',3'-cyclic phosphodiesterase [Ruminiclostridium sp.]
MRLFIAIKFNDPVNSALLSMQEQLRSANIRGNYTKPENLHLTLAFIGEYGDPDYVLETLEQVRFRPFELAIDGVGSFGKLWWAGLTASVGLHNTAARIRHLLAGADIPFDRKKFSPHITLVREPNKPSMPAIEVPEASMTVEEISLMRSERGRNGMIYTDIGTVRHS